MTTTRMIRGLQSNIACTPNKRTAAECEWIALPNTAQCEFLGLRYIALDEIIEKDKGESRFSLQDVLFGLREILFPDRERETYRRLEGDDMTPITVYKFSDRYIVAGGGNRLAAARYLGQAFILAEVWELP
ncbi:MAG: hypothetical protein JXR84_21430 [Anaerolineae bacterium]|nr:hypothetical protein [Anaerolineae bacterium]